MKMRPRSCPETSVTNYHSILRKTREEHKFVISTIINNVSPNVRRFTVD